MIFNNKYIWQTGRNSLKFFFPSDFNIEYFLNKYIFFPFVDLDSFKVKSVETKLGEKRKKIVDVS